MSTADQVLAVAASQIGTHESPAYSNDVLYTRWAGMVGQPWCDMFVSWCFDRAGMGATEGRWAYTPSHANNFAARGRWHPGTAGIARGDVLFFDFPGGPDRISHVGFVESVGPAGIRTIEGNTNGAGSRDGGEVMRHTRTSSIVGYGRPAYDQGDLPTMPLNATDMGAIGLLLIKYDHEVALPRERRTRRLIKALAEQTGMTDDQIRSVLNGADLEHDLDDDERTPLAARARHILPTADDIGPA